MSESSNNSNIVFIGLIGSLITIVVFLTGKSKLSDYIVKNPDTTQKQKAVSKRDISFKKKAPAKAKDTLPDTIANQNTKQLIGVEAFDIEQQDNDTLARELVKVLNCKFTCNNFLVLSPFAPSKTYSNIIIAHLSVKNIVAGELIGYREETDFLNLNIKSYNYGNRMASSERTYDGYGNPKDFPWDLKIIRSPEELKGGFTNPIFRSMLKDICQQIKTDKSFFVSGAN